MLFNSGVFLKFFAAFLLLYYLVRDHLAARNLLIVAASYLFYGWWDYRFLGLLLLSSSLDYGIGLGLDRWQDPRKRKLLVSLSVLANLSILGFFKYYGFFVKSFAELSAALGFTVHPGTLNIVLPVGISFYTFQSFSYTIDIYRREIQASRNLIHFFAFVSFFPQLVAGPIQRARHLLPQFSRTQRITLVMLQEGIWLSLWGLFQKVVLADNFAPLADMVYRNPLSSGPLVVLGTIAFGLQIYCDFSGYSNIARGTARILGFDIVANFNLPYTASDLREFWQRWHISLSTWLRDYLYISLGGNRAGPIRTYRNLVVTMLLGGLWHGAAWNFVLWGAWHGAGLVVHRFWRSRKSTASSGLGNAIGWCVTMAFVFYGWLLFRAGSWAQIVTLTRAITCTAMPRWTASYLTSLLVFALPLVAMEVWQKKSGNLLVPLTVPRWASAGLQGALVIATALFWEKEKIAFLYFQF